jgi:hypothetical protein
VVQATEADMQVVIQRYQSGKLAPRIKGEADRRKQTDSANKKQRKGR